MGDDKTVRSADYAYRAEWSPEDGEWVTVSAKS